MGIRGAARALTAAAFLAAVASASPLSAQQQSGTITGRVTDAVSGAPVAAAQVSVVGTNIGALANGEGQFTLRGVPAGNHQVRVLRVGYAEQTQQVGVAAGQTATANFQMQPVSVQLTPVVTTATGEQRAVEVGNAIARVNAENLVQTRPIGNMGDLLTARAAGVQVLPGNSTGTGARVRIRGRSSLSLTNDPIYIIDGVRMEASSNSTSIGVGGTTPSRVTDINPEEIESIEVVKGPSAATLYGTDAANGVIVIKTKRGTAGPPQWTAYTEQGLIKDRNDWPANWTSFGTRGTSVTASCFNYLQALDPTNPSYCTRDSVRSFNPAKADGISPLGTGHRQQYGLQLRGGTDAVRYFVSGEWEDEVGVQKIPGLERQRLLSEGITILPEWNRPNAYTRGTARANLNVTLPQNADLAFSAGYISSEGRYPQNDNNVTGWGPTLYGGFGDVDPNDHTTAYGFYPPGDLYQETVTQEIDRFIGSTNGNWRPTEWLALRGNLGIDYVSRVDSDLCRFATCANFATNRQGFKVDNRTNFYVYTLDFGATGTFQLLPTLNSKTSVGGQFYRNLFDRNGASSTQLPPGATSVTAGAVKDAEEATTESRTLGFYVEEALAWRDRVFLTGAVRSDRNSAFGADFETVYYPKASLSWVLSDEGFFPQVGWLDQLRLRSAYGASGVQPGTTDAVQYFATNSVRIADTDQPGLAFEALGNQDLKPERSVEFEAGIDGTFWNNRLTAELTYYNKESKDALVQRVLPGSVGTGLTNRFENLGRVKNWGWEALLNAQLLQRQAFGWDVTLNGSYNENKLVELGENIPPIIGRYNRQVPGYPLSGYWERPFTYRDANNDGLIAPDEVEVGADFVFLGYEQPRTEISLTNGFDFFDRSLRLTAMFDYKGGHKLLNLTERYRCLSFNNCEGLANPNASLEDQARAVAARTGTVRSEAGYIEDGDYIRFREVSLTYTAPEAFVRRYLRTSRLSATLAARNIALWTDYSGVDPEMNAGQGDVQNEFLTQPPQSTLSLRVNIGF